MLQFRSVESGLHAAIESIAIDENVLLHYFDQSKFDKVLEHMERQENMVLRFSISHCSAKRSKVSHEKEYIALIQ